MPVQGKGAYDEGGNHNQFFLSRIMFLDRMKSGLDALAICFHACLIRR